MPPLHPTITSRQISTKSLNINILEANNNQNNPLLLLLHGFPELAYSWRKVIPPLAAAGYHVVAPDLRGFGRTTGWDAREFDHVDLSTFSPLSIVRDIVLLVYALGYESVRCLVGHDLGAMAAAACVIARPDLFRSLVLISHPFAGTPKVPFGTASTNNGNIGGGGGGDTRKENIHTTLETLNRKHYQNYYSTRDANTDMLQPSPNPNPDVNNLHTFLRGYFYLKSGSWPGNAPKPVANTAHELATNLPYYYIMPLHATMPEAISLHINEEPHGIDTATQRTQSWLSDDELDVYVAEFARTGFQGGLNYYRVNTAPDRRYSADYEIFAGRRIEVPCSFVSGRSDWGVFKESGALEGMTGGRVCADFRELRLVDGVGHWAAQECPGVVVEVVLNLVGDT